MQKKKTCKFISISICYIALFLFFICCSPVDVIRSCSLFWSTCFLFNWLDQSKSWKKKQRSKTAHQLTIGSRFSLHAASTATTTTKSNNLSKKWDFVIVVFQICDLKGVQGIKGRSLDRCYRRNCGNCWSCRRKLYFHQSHFLVSVL